MSCGCIRRTTYAPYSVTMTSWNAMQHSCPCSLSMEGPPCDIHADFQALMGGLLFLLICMCPDISYVVNRLSQHNPYLRPDHMTAARCVLQYLKGLMNLCIHYRSSSGPLVLAAFSDSDWAGLINKISVSSYCWFYGGCLVNWGSKKQRTVALSSTEAEYMALMMCLQTGLWLHSSLHQLSLLFVVPIPIAGDNEGSISLASNSSYHSRLKHIDIKYHFICEHVESGWFSVHWIPTSDNIADILTKPVTL